MANRYRVSFWGDENVLILIVVMVAQFCEYTKSIELYILFLFIYLFIYLFSCAVWHVGSYFPDQGSNLCPLQWERKVLTTGPLGKSRIVHFKWVYCMVCELYLNKAIKIFLKRNPFCESHLQDTPNLEDRKMSRESQKKRKSQKEFYAILSGQQFTEKKLCS